MDALNLKQVDYRYPESQPALQDVNLRIAPGEKVALVGPNGAGKSTLLHLMAGLFRPSAGAVEVGGVRSSKKEAPQVRRQVGFLFQDPDDQIFMPSVFEDVAFGPINMKLSEEEVKQRVAKAMADCGISDFGDRVPHRLSLGEKKRVAMAGLLAMSPDILLLDEPTANLDPLGRRDLGRVLQACPETIFLGHAPGFWIHISNDEHCLKEDYPPENAKVAEPGRIPALLRKYPNLYCDISAGSGCRALSRDPDHAKNGRGPPYRRGVV